jgi:GTP cyclohydrolase II
MKSIIGSPIRLKTRAGDFTAYHALVQDSRGLAVREGVLLESPPQNHSEPLNVRVQSSCLFSESFWATDCDCALQLQASLDLVAQHGGLVLYFYEEGRGAGLATKFEAMRLQQANNWNTKRAYECLKLDPDARSYEAAATVLRSVLEPRTRSIRLWSNNKEKEESLRREGINVFERASLICGWETPAIRQYLIDKRNALGHDIPGNNGEKP